MAPAKLISIFQGPITINWDGKEEYFKHVWLVASLLTEYRPGIENYFEIDKEIVCFHNADEMIDKIIYYLNHEGERRAIAQAGWKRATSEHTSFHMLSRVFGEMEKDIAAKGREGSPHPQELKMPNQYPTIHSIFGHGFIISLVSPPPLWWQGNEA